ncbi:MAG: T9SS type A sorting domain-containing protein [Bacteroidetes bacterium]|nr:MAG: T9SS type A sorting domain-containing protein [Bacteroidota bacterium]
MKKLKNIALIAIGLAVTNLSYGYNHDQKKGTKKGGSATYNKANCAPASSKLIIEFNDVKALMEPGGLLFLDRANGAAYEVPKGGGVMAIYAGSLWMGGTDVNGQLKLAAQRFRDSGVDFWTGPLTVTQGSGNYDPLSPVGDNARRDYGEATIIPEQCLAYDKFFSISKAEVVQFAAWYEYNLNPIGDPVEAPSNESMNRINNWPAHGDVSLGQDFYLAPFYDNNQDGVYDPLEGDHPWYDDILGRDDVECGVDRRITLFGDETHWWVFNDKGNIHGETGGDPIGMEIRAQAFAFATDDEINRMTFYNYELINRGTQTLQDTYFSKYVDSDLGNYNDDYVGCDVTRGLGYCFNGDLLDEQNTSSQGYGANPPAIGVDFFEGPYQDADGVDNIGPVDSLDENGNFAGLIIPSVAEAIADKGIVYRGIGLGYGDNIIDNERFGMRSFMYYTAGAGAGQSDPRTAAQHYNYMQGNWSNGTQTVYGGTGFPGSTGSTTIQADYMFPDDSDTLNWGTKGEAPGFPWSEVTDGNEPGDRRFVQSAGPFTLKPGAVNNITVGIVYGRSTDGDAFASVRALKRADTKAQALFDNCFRIFDPPQAPKLTIQEVENALILMLDNPPSTSNNGNEEYKQEDKINIPVDIIDRTYIFEGYQIYQLAGEDNSAADIGDPTKARLVAQCDIKNNISRIVNFEFDEGLGFSIPVEKVDGSNEGIKHSFKITEDQFAQGERTLVNHKRYYYTAIAYAYNQYKEYDPNDPEKLDGQKRPYVSSRLGYDGAAIQVMEGIPHDPTFEKGGTIIPLDYGSSPEITRLDGRGNGNRSVELTQASIDYIIANGYQTNPTYKKGAGPLNVKVIDPLNTASGYFECRFRDYVNNGSDESRNYQGTDTASWVVYRYDKKGGSIIDSVASDRTIEVANEQLIPEWGISIEIYQDQYYMASGSGAEYQRYTPPIEAVVEYEDSTRQWLSFVEDDGAFFPTNWIRSGDYEPQAGEDNPDLGVQNPTCYADELGEDVNNSYSSLLGGGIAPYRLVGYQCDYMPIAYPANYTSFANSRNRNGISRAPSVDIVITNDKSKWTRCAVVELGRDENLNVGGVAAGNLRGSLSVDKEGNPDGSGTNGMGWFPGYAIDVETGMRLHMAFGENSFLGGENGSDMIWNPTSNLVNSTGGPLLGGLQPVYVFGYRVNDETDASRECPYYDGVNTWVIDKFQTASSSSFSDIFMNLVWVVNPMLAQGQELMSNDLRIKVRVNKEYNDFVATNANGGRPMYGWTMDGLSTQTSVASAVQEKLDKISIVPNPYYAYSEYERNRLDTRVKLTNLPQQCTIKIYNVSGKLIRTYKKDNDLTYLDWDMKNSKGIPISSGVYMIHVDIPDVGETVIKFFGGVRQIDLENI